ncbi:hypothetical protein HPB49_015735 [Dermacentor silvarum]|uniref:Uncharacterized protein n=1 Tax=Dermacentor silvarum TaxID=543639 RepID=A0ACB8DQJ1_DERSI|nr:hypothetical protein HPB49_015735 [Dermacentor silvarum]
MLVDDHLDRLLEMAPIRSSANLDKLRDLYHEITLRTSAPEGLGVSPDEYAACLRRVIMKALPPDLGILYRRWLQEASSSNHDDTAVVTEDKFKQVEHLMTFLRIQVEAREARNFDQASSSASQRLHRREQRPMELNPPYPAALPIEVRTPYTCPRLLCNASDHTAQECSMSLTS